MNTKIWVAIGAIVVIVLALGAWMSFQRYQTPPASSQNGQTLMPKDQVSQGTREIMVEGKEFEFVPKAISVTAGENIRIKFKNMGQFPHNLTIEGLGLATKQITLGQEDTIEFTADKTGTFTIFCSVGNHRARGMEGTFQVQ